MTSSDPDSQGTGEASSAPLDITLGVHLHHPHHRPVGEPKTCQLRLQWHHFIHHWRCRHWFHTHPNRASSSARRRHVTGNLESRHYLCLGDHRTHRHQYGVLRCLGHHPRGCQSCRCLHDTAHWNRPLSLVPRSIGRIPRGYCVSMYEYSEQILKFWGHRRRCRTNCPTHESNLLPHYSSCFSFRSTRVRLLSPRSSSCLPPAPAIHPESTSQRGVIHPRRNSGRSSAPPQRPCHMTPVMRLR